MYLYVIGTLLALLFGTLLVGKFDVVGLAETWYNEEKEKLTMLEKMNELKWEVIKGEK